MLCCINLNADKCYAVERFDADSASLPNPAQDDVMLSRGALEEQREATSGAMRFTIKKTTALTHLFGSPTFFP